MDLTNAALVAIDHQMAFDSPPWPRRWNKAADKNGLELLRLWRYRGRPLVHVRHDSVEAGSTLAPGTPGNRFRPGFGPRGDEQLVSKSVNAAFIGTDLDLRLRRLGIGTLVVFGFTTDMCVSTTVRVGANMGYRMVVVEDACDCFDLPDGKGGTVEAEVLHRAHIASLAYDFAMITTLREVALAFEGMAVA